MSRIALAFLLLVALAVLPRAGRAYSAEGDAPAVASADDGSAPGSQPQSIDSNVFRRLAPGTRLRIYTDGGMIEGTFERFVADTLWLASADPTAIPAPAIDRLWEGSNGAATGALVGAGILGGLGFGLGSWAKSTIETDDHVAIKLGAVGAISGLVLGAIFGSGSTHWSQRHP